MSEKLGKEDLINHVEYWFHELENGGHCGVCKQAYAQIKKLIEDSDKDVPWRCKYCGEIVYRPKDYAVNEPCRKCGRYGKTTSEPDTARAEPSEAGDSANRIITHLESALGQEFVSNRRYQLRTFLEIEIKQLLSRQATVEPSEVGYEIREGTDMEWGIYLKEYNVRIATFSKGTAIDRERIKQLLSRQSRRSDRYDHRRRSS